jgi:hypothetical protein
MHSLKRVEADWSLETRFSPPNIARKKLEVRLEFEK